MQSGLKIPPAHPLLGPSNLHRENPTAALLLPRDWSISGQPSGPTTSPAPALLSSQRRRQVETHAGGLLFRVSSSPGDCFPIAGDLQFVFRQPSFLLVLLLRWSDSRRREAAKEDRRTALCVCFAAMKKEHPPPTLAAVPPSVFWQSCIQELPRNTHLDSHV